MKRFKLFLAMAALACAIGLTVKYGSTYRPVVEPVREIEEIWALEDAREESGEPLVTRLFCNGIPMAYDAENNVFYGSLGLENGAQWPEIKLTASEETAKGLSLCFADDYGFDDCDAAIREGYSYQIFAYTDTAYSYAEVVFTGLPLVNVTADQTIEREDVPAQIEIALAAEGLQTNGRIHKRGGASILNDKVGYKLEFTRTTDGKKKIYREIPGMGTDSQVILLPMNALDTTMMRDRLSWALYARLTRRDEPFSARKTQYCELFLNGEYRGVYLMLEPFSVRQEVAKAGEERLSTDSVYRTAVISLSHGRPCMEDPYSAATGFELYYPMDGEPDFSPLADYFALLGETDDAAFMRRAAQIIDLDSALRYDVVLQLFGLTDNVINNMYTWAQNSRGYTRYRFDFWDLDVSWGLKRDEIGEMHENWVFFPLVDRLLRADEEGGVRRRYGEIYREVREKAFDTETVEALVGQYAHELNDSGAMARNAERWETENYAADGYELVAFAAERIALLDEPVRAMSAGEEIDLRFLEKTNYDDKGTPLSEE